MILKKRQMLRCGSEITTFRECRNNKVFYFYEITQ